MDEVWRRIPGFHDYEVSNLGRVRSWKPLSPTARPPSAPRVIAISEAGDGYLQAALRRDLKGHLRKIHRLVLEAFVGPCPSGMECRHLNGNPKDNRLQNLAWGTKKENAADQVRHGTRVSRERHRELALVHSRKAEEHGLAKLTNEQACSIFASYHAGVASQAKLASAHGVSQKTISNIVRGTAWQTATAMFFAKAKETA